MNEPLFPFRPNWSRPVLERLEWLSDVIESKNGTEERINLRSFPRRSLEYALVLRGHALARFDAMLWAYQAERVIVPIWTDPQDLGAPLAAGATTIAVATDTFDFHDGGLAVLYGSDSEYEVVTIDTVSVGLVGLSSATLNAWPAGTRVYPARYGRMPADVSLSRSTDAVAQGSIRFDLENSAVPALPGDTIYRGVEVNLRKPNWAQGVSNVYRRKIERLDYLLGKVFVDDQSGLQTSVRTHSHLLRGRADIAEYRGWLHARAGRVNAFWQPQLQMDLEQTAPISAAGVALTVRGLGYEENYNLAAGRQDIALRHRATGQWYFRRVTGATVSGDNDVLTISSALGIDAAPGDLAITWLMLSRLEADAVELAWHTDRVAVSPVDFRSIRA